MVKIRYAELPAGLHVATEAADRCTVVYLKPGLTREQRKDALMVARRSARFGNGPSLPTLDMAFALAADRTRTSARVGAWAVRKHPLLLLPVVALILGIIAVSIMAAAAVITLPPPASAAQPGLYEVNVGQLVYPSLSLAPAPRSGAPRSGPPGSAAIGQVHPAPHGGRALHGAGRSRAHRSAGMQPRAVARRWPDGSSLTGAEVASRGHHEVHGAGAPTPATAADGPAHGLAHHGSAASAPGTAVDGPAGARPDGHARHGADVSASGTMV
jgi:hypothetical protein